MNSTLKIVSLVEATTLNAVARIVLEFFKTARELAGQSNDVPAVEGSIITFDRLGQSSTPNEFIAAARSAGMEISVIPEKRRFDLSVIAALRAEIEQRQPDLVITNSVKSHFLFWRTRLGRQYPWVAFHHGYTATDLKMRAYNRLDRWSLPKADRIVTVCRPFARELARLTAIPERKIFVQHNSIRPPAKAGSAEVHDLKHRLRIGEHERVILAVGRLSKEKAHADLIEAFEHLRKDSSDLHLKLLIVGEGPERSNLESIARAAGLNENVIFAGQVGDVAPFYSLADVFVLPSHSEGSPNVLLEAMAAEVPVVATAVGGVPEIVRHNESALLVLPREPVAMTRAIRQVLNDNNLSQRLIAKAATLVINNHSPEKYARSLLTLYCDLVDAREPRAES